MAKVIIKVRVAYPSNLIEVFDSQASVRKISGERSSSVCFLPEDPNVTFFILDWKHVEEAKIFWASKSAINQMAQWHSVGSPEILFLEEFRQQ
ncbi:MAG: hypothetical protein IPH22_11275 [Nitrosomonas sp.]|nr:hypothetical protein [Nitrosomonas sp.]